MTSTLAPAADAPEAEDEGADGPRRSRLGVHLGLYALLLVGLLALTPTLEPWANDDGVYFHAVRVVSDGSWFEEQPGLGLDADPTRYPLALAEVDTEGRAFPYVKHPLWVVVQRASTALTGERVGFVLPNLVGCALAAVAAWAAVRRLRVGSPAVAFWLVGIGPLAVLGTSLWSHAVAAAAGGAAALLVMGLVERRSPARAVLLGLALGLTLALRTEGPLLVVGAVAALVLVRPGPWRDVRRLIDPALAGAVAVGAFLAERAWIAAIAADPLTSSGPDAGMAETWLEGRVLSSWRTFFVGADGDRNGELLTIAMLTCAVAGVVRLLRGKDRRGATVLFVLAAVAGVARYALFPSGGGALIPGVVPAWPVMAAGVYLWITTWRDAGRPERALAVLIGTFTAALLATQYDGGAGTDWGGRYLTPIAVPLAVLAVAALTRVAAGPDTTDREVGARLLRVTLGLGLVLAALGTVVTLTARHDVAEDVAEVRATDAEVVIAERAFAPRTDQQDDTTTYWRRPGEEGEVADAVARAFADGHRRVGVFGAGAGELDVPGADVEVVHDELAIYTR